MISKGDAPLKTIDIITAHNVTISYELATVGQRILAFLLDAVIVLVWGVIVNLIGTMIFLDFSYFDANYETQLENYQIFLFFFLMPAVFCYHLISENFFNGQSIGKLALGIRVVSTSGKNAKTWGLLYALGISGY